MSVPVALSPPLTSREAITDTLYRFILGIDTNDVALFNSAFTEDARWDLNGKIVEGLKTIQTDCYERTLSTLDTTHFVSNIRINVLDGGAEASLSALFQAQHYRGGAGPIPDSARFLMGGQYFLDLTKDDTDGLWKITVFKTRTIWTEGDRSVMGH